MRIIWVCMFDVPVFHYAKLNREIYYSHFSSWRRTVNVFLPLASECDTQYPRWCPMIPSSWFHSLESLPLLHQGWPMWQAEDGKNGSVSLLRLLYRLDCCLFWITCSRGSQLWYHEQSYGKADMVNWGSWATASKGLRPPANSHVSECGSRLQSQVKSSDDCSLSLHFEWLHETLSQNYISKLPPDSSPSETAW